MKNCINLLFICVLILSFCGCQTAKKPSTVSSISPDILKEDATSIIHSAEASDSVTSKETGTSVDDTTHSSSASEATDSSSTSYEKSSKSNTNSQKTSIASNSSYVSNTSKPSTTSSEYDSSRNTCFPLPRPDFDRLDTKEPDAEFLEWAKSRYLSEYISESKEDGKFLLWAGTQKGILMPKVDDGFELHSIDVECEETLRYEMVYYSQGKISDRLYLVLYPIKQEDKTSKTLLDLIKKYNYRTGRRETKYKKGKDKCTWGTYYVETSYFGTVWFQHNNYLISCEYKNKFNAEVFKLIDFEFKDFGNIFSTEQDFVDWIKTNRSNPDKSKEGKYLLRELKTKSKMVLPKIKSDGFYLKEIYPVSNSKMYRAVYTTDKPINGIESLEFDICVSEKVNEYAMDLYKQYFNEKTLSQKPEIVKSSNLQKCNGGNYIIHPELSTVFFSHKDFDIKYTVNFKDKDKSGGFKEEYFDLFDIEYVSIEK